MLVNVHPKAHSTIKMADKIEEIVKCKHCYLYLPVSVLEQHWKNNCPVKLDPLRIENREAAYLKVPHFIPIKNR